MQQLHSNQDKISLVVFIEQLLTTLTIFSWYLVKNESQILHVLNSCQILKTNHDTIWFSGQHCAESVRIWSFSGLHFPALGLNTERCSVFFCIQSECGKIRARKTPNKDTFYAVLFFVIEFCHLTRAMIWSTLYYFCRGRYGSFYPTKNACKI